MILLISPSLRTVTKFRKDRMVSNGIEPILLVQNQNSAV